jgi:hypothetical protein
MSSVPARMRRVTTLVGVLAIAALALTSCGATKAASVTRLDGTPAASISVPLSVVACTPYDFCVVAGTSSNSAGSSAVAEGVPAHGPWKNVVLPQATTPVLSSASCSIGACLLGGSSAGRDLLWSYDAPTETVTSATPPAGGTGINALTCSKTNCALVDAAIQGGLPRLSLSADDGVTWTTPLSVAWASHETVTTLACTSLFDCIVGAISSTRQLSLEVTHDGGVSWNALTPPAKLGVLTSLTCTFSRCVALSTSSGGSSIAFSDDFGQRWTTTRLAAQVNALSCDETSRCVVVGEQSNGAAWLANALRHGDKFVLTTASLRYVPTPLLGVSCGNDSCSAVGVTTLVRTALAS